MKKMMKTLALVAAAAMGLTACQNDFEEQVQVKDSVVVNFVADSAESRTSVDTSGATPVFSWNTEESFAVLEQTTSLAEATTVEYTKVDGKANIKATFNANPDKAEYKYVTIYPASGYAGGAESIESVTLNLPSVQTMAEGSYDPAADLMVSEVVETSAQPTEAQMVRFTRLAAVVKMSLKNFGVALGDKVQSVTFEANGKALAGDVTVNFAKLFEEDGITHKLTAAAEMSSSVTVNTTSAGDIYFTTLPTTLAAGDAYTITIVTDKYLYVKKGTIPEEKTLTFAAGMVTRFGVDMNGVAPSNKWKLVKDASTLKSGDVVTFVNATATFNNYYALSAKYSTNYPYAATTAIVKLGDYLYHPISEDLADRIQQVTLSKRYDDKVAFDFYNAADEFTGDDKSGFYSSTSSNMNFKLQAYPNNNTLFYITIENGVASVVAKDASYDYKYLQFKPGNTASSTSRYFQLRDEANSASNPVCIYKLEGVENREIPVVKADVTVPIPTSSDAKEVVIAEEGVTAGDISAVTFNYVGDWTISVSDVVKGETGDATWLDVTYDKANNCLTYTAEPNSGAVRYATVTITATLDGEEPLTWSFGMLQKGAPMEISIAEFMQKGKDLNVSYKLTGILQEVPSSGSASTTYKLADKNGNVAQIKYLQTDAGVQVPGNDDIVFQKGDVVTVTTVVTSTKGQGGSSTYPSYYKGYYRLKATATPSIVDYVGGDATITVTTEGNLLPADGVIEGAMAEAYDFVTFNHTDGDATATATFATNSGGSRSAEFNFTYGMASASVSVGQKNDPSVKVGWFLVTDASELKVGDKVIIAGKSVDGKVDYAIKKYASSNPSTTPAITIELQGNEIASVEGVEQFTLGSGHTDYAGTWAFKCDSYSRYLNITSGSLKLSSSLAKEGSWTIDIAEDGKATLVSKTTNSKTTIMFNDASGTKSFTSNTPSTTGKGAIYLYKYYN